MKKTIIYIVTVILSISIGVGGTFLVLHYFPQNVINENKNVTIIEENTIKEAIDKIYDAVVLVESYNNDRLISTGTGFVYKKDNDYGYIITNHHVIESSNKIIITLITGEEVEAKLLGSEEYSDIAVLSITSDKVLQVAQIGDSTKTNIGDTLFTVGSPMGKDYMGTVTKGILSGKERAVEVKVGSSEYVMEVLQTDAAINPGNSGGPLVNINGEVIGVNSLKLVQDTIEGMGFAIPIEIAISAAETLEKGETITRPLLGVQLVDVANTYVLYRYGIELTEDIEEGVVIVEVELDSPASSANLKKGYVILEINGTKIKSIAHFRSILYKYNIGDTITIKYYDNNTISDVEVLLDKGIE